MSTVTSTSTSATATATSTSQSPAEEALQDQGIGILAFLAALASALVIFGVQLGLFLLLRNRLARIFKPKTYLVPERERTESPPSNVFGMFSAMMRYSDREVINKCGLDAYFFLRYLKTLLVIFVPIAAVVIPILIPINYVGGIGQSLDVNLTDSTTTNDGSVRGLDTLAWGNVAPKNMGRRWAHLILALCVVAWVCTVFFFELRVYVKVRQDYLTSAEHRLRASATTVLVNNIPRKWLTEEALRGLFDVFPGGIRNVWLTRDLSELLDKIKERDKTNSLLEKAQTELVKLAKKKQLKKKAAEDKERRRQLHMQDETKEERAARNKKEDAEALDLATRESDATEGQEKGQGQREQEQEQQFKKRKGLNFLADPMAKFGRTTATADGILATSGGFAASAAGGRDSPRPPSRAVNSRPATAASDPFRGGHSRTVSAASGSACSAADKEKEMRSMGLQGNTVRKLSNLQDMFVDERVRFWQFWKPPGGGYASPVPQEVEENPFEGKSNKTGEKEEEATTTWQKLKSKLPFAGGGQVEKREYPEYLNKKDGNKTDENEDKSPEWEKWLEESDRPTHKLPVLGFLPGLPLIGEKVDTIYWCRERLARLNMEIEEDQRRPERYPLMNSAFVQFNHQVSAHMACQSLIHHLPKQMAPRQLEVSPRDVIWDNMAMGWWQEWLRSGLVFATIFFMAIFWAVPVAWTAAFSQINRLVAQVSWLRWIDRNPALHRAAEAVAGILPAALLSLLLAVVPFVLTLLATFKGVKTGAQRTEFVQKFFFMFLFVQVFLVVSVSTFFASSFETLFDNLSNLSQVDYVLDVLAQNLPRAANYFFSYMILQALSSSSGTLLQIGALLVLFLVARAFDSTARSKWARSTKLSEITWGSFFPVYTNFACIGLVYSIVAPLISLFVILTFGLLWVAQRYSMLYVTRFASDTGGVLYPRAINQTFTGLYVMELCLAGLFYIDRDNGSSSVQGTIMIVSIFLTVVYQLLLNYSFSPLFRYLPITVEDEAVLRDEMFQKAQDKRLGLIDEGEGEGEGDDEEDGAGAASRLVDKKDWARQSSHDGGEDPPALASGSVELDELRKSPSLHKAGGGGGGLASTSLRNPAKIMGHVGSWAKRGTQSTARRLAAGGRSAQAVEYRARQRRRDVEAQRAMGEALYGGMHDEIEDLTPEERDAMVRHAFQHYALRARRPAVWIPKDDLGVSDDEIARAKRYSDYLWMSNEGTALDSKVRVVFGRAPPDFSEVDLVNL